MKNDVLEIFDGVENVEFMRFAYCEESSELPVFTLAEETAEEWNAKARIQNTKAFIGITGRQPKDYHEVLSWVFSLIEDTEKAPAVTGA